MQDLEKQEQFEIEVLDVLNSDKLLNSLIFSDGSMLRLCFGLPRFSVDLDFFTAKGCDTDKLFDTLRMTLDKRYSIKDASNKFFTLLFEIRNSAYPRSLKIEIRKGDKEIKTEQAIAFSRYSSKQILLNVVSLQSTMELKIEAFIDREEIRDIFDIEFLFKKGIAFNTSQSHLRKMLEIIDYFKKTDYTVKLGSLLEEVQRRYYRMENFKIIKMAIIERLVF